MDSGEIVNALLGSGPLAIVLGYACHVLWSALRKERQDKDEMLKCLLNPGESHDGE